MIKRSFAYLVIWGLTCFSVPLKGHAQSSHSEKIPTVVITDLYYPYEDPGDNFDLIMAYGLPEIDLKAVILDISNAFRKPVADHPRLWKDPNGPREAGIIPVIQLNYIFDRTVPYGIGPMDTMRSLTDKMTDIPKFQQSGVELLIKTLRAARTPVTILSFGSARVLAVAYNQEPELLKKKIKKVYLSAGTASPNFSLGKDKGANAIPGGEWNVALDVNAFVRLLRSQLPIALFPCAGKDGAFSLDPHDTYWQLPNLQFVRKLDVRLQRYLYFAFRKILAYDYLRQMDVGKVADSATIAGSFPKPHRVWETALWIHASGRKLVKQADGRYAILAPDEITTGDHDVSGTLRPCEIDVRYDGRFSYKFTKTKSHFSLYERTDPYLNQVALQQALPSLYESFNPSR